MSEIDRNLLYPITYLSKPIIIYLIKVSKMCPIFWDSVLCWPEGSLNQTYFMPCPIYVDKFNRKSKRIDQIRI